MVKEGADQLRCVAAKVNNLELTALVDTGSQYDVVSEAVWKRLGSPELRPMRTRVVGAGGAPLPVQGQTRLTLAVGKRSETFHPIVVTNLGVDAILGLPSQTTMGMVINPKANTVELENGDKVTMLMDKKRPAIAVIKDEQFGETLTSEQKKQLADIIKPFEGTVLVKELTGESTMKNVEHTIPTGDHRPIAVPLKRLSPGETQQLAEQVRELEKKGVLRPSSSPWCARALLVPKKDGTQRMVIDYTLLNRATKRDQHPLPNINLIFQYLGNAKYFTTLDLASGYYQFKVAEHDIEKTAFATPDGLYEFVKMPMGTRRRHSSAA